MQLHWRLWRRSCHADWPGMYTLRRARRTVTRDKGGGALEFSLEEWKAFLSSDTFAQASLSESQSSSSEGRWKWSADVCDENGSVVFVFGRAG